MSPDQRRYEFEGEPPDPGRLAADDERLPWPSPEWSEELAAPVRWPSALDDDLRRDLLDAFADEPAETVPSRATLASRLRLPARAVIVLVIVAGAATAIALGSAGGGSAEPKQTGGATTTGQVTTTAPENARRDEGQGAREEVSDQGDRGASPRRPASELSGARPPQADGASTARPRTSPAAQVPTPLPADRPSIEFEPGPWSAQ